MSIEKELRKELNILIQDSIATEGVMQCIKKHYVFKQTLKKAINNLINTRYDIASSRKADFQAGYSEALEELKQSLKLSQSSEPKVEGTLSESPTGNTMNAEQSLQNERSGSEHSGKASDDTLFKDYPEVRKAYLKMQEMAKKYPEAMNELMRRLKRGAK